MGFFEGIEEITKPDTDGASVIEETAALESLLPNEEGIPASEASVAPEPPEAFEEEIPEPPVSPVKQPEAKEQVPPVQEKNDKSTQTKDKPVNKTAESNNTVISFGTKVGGNISSEGGISVNGEVSGSLTAKGNVSVMHNGKVLGDITAVKMVNVAGKVKGNIDAGIVAFDKAKVVGNVKSAKDVKISNGTVIIGNIIATAAEINGAVNGDIDVKGPVVVSGTAIIKGNIKSATITISDGAAIEGVCSQTYAKVNPTEFFKQFETKEDKKNG